MSTYRLGAYANGAVGLQDIENIVGVPPHPTEFLEFNEQVGITLSGKPIEAGAPRVKWTWGELDQWQFHALAAYCTGATAPVYIQTRVNTGVNYHYGIFKATMTRPRATTAPGYRRTEVEVVFVNLQSP